MELLVKLLIKLTCYKDRIFCLDLGYFDKSPFNWEMNTIYTNISIKLNQGKQSLALKLQEKKSKIVYVSINTPTLPPKTNASFRVKSTNDVASPGIKSTIEVTSPGIISTIDVTSPGIKSTNDGASHNVKSTNDVASPGIKSTIEVTSPGIIDFASPGIISTIDGASYPSTTFKLHFTFTLDDEFNGVNRNDNNLNNNYKI
ncbi:hypothetical protein ACTFIW_000080 [Dictyostelium discoideum]